MWRVVELFVSIGLNCSSLSAVPLHLQCWFAWLGGFCECVQLVIDVPNYSNCAIVRMMRAVCG